MAQRAKRYQKGAVIVMFALYTVAVAGLLALAVNVYLIGNALMQQRTAVEYVAMSVLKIAKDPAIPFPATCMQSDLALMNCILARAEMAGRVAVGFSPNSYYLPPGVLRMVTRGDSGSSSDDSCGSQGGGGVIDPNNPTPPKDPKGEHGGMSEGDFCWTAYKVQDESQAELVMGTYTDDSGTGKGTFYAAQPGQVVGGSPNAIKLRFHLDQAGDAKMLAPLVAVFGESIKLKFSSAAVAYVTPGGNIQLAVDPNLSMDSNFSMQ